MTTSVVAIVTDAFREGRRVIGYGFSSVGRYAVSDLLRTRFIPRILQAPPEAVLDNTGENFDPQRIWNLVMSGEKPGGHGERAGAVGALDMAIWDAVAKIEGKPLYRILAERFSNGKVNGNVFTYAAGGYYQPGKSSEALKSEIQHYLELGYSTVKIKIGGAPLDEDVERIKVALDMVKEGRFLAVDANGRFDLPAALKYAEILSPYSLRWFEEPGDPLDFALQNKLSKAYEHPMATGENLFSMQDARNLITYGGLRPDRDILQFDPVLSYGLVEYLRTIDMLKANGWSAQNCIPHGGNLFAAHVAAGLETGGVESYPGVFQPFGGFSDDTIVEKDRVRLPEVPGIGYERKTNLYSVLRTLAE